MRIYIAAPFPQREAAQALKQTLIKQGHSVTASWIDSKMDEMPPKDIAIQDLIDIRQADALIALTTDSTGSLGGMHFEAGYALAYGRKVFKIGPAVNVFYEHPDIKDWPTEVDVAKSQ